MKLQESNSLGNGRHNSKHNIVESQILALRMRDVEVKANIAVGGFIVPYWTELSLSTV